MGEVNIEALEQTIGSVKIKLATSDGRRFWLKIDAAGLSFFSRQSSAGNLEGKPIVKSADQLFEWIGPEGDKKKFRDRKGVQPHPNSFPEGEGPRIVP